MFTVTLSAVSGQTVTVNYATATGTTESGDHNTPSGTLTFAPGDTTKTVVVTINDDGTYEGLENYTVTLSGATNATIGDNTGSGGITSAIPLAAKGGAEGESPANLNMNWFLGIDATSGVLVADCAAETGNYRVPAPDGKLQAVILVDSYPAMLPEKLDVDDPNGALDERRRGLGGIRFHLDRDPAVAARPGRLATLAQRLGLLAVQPDRPELAPGLTQPHPVVRLAGSTRSQRDVPAEGRGALVRRHRSLVARGRELRPGPDSARDV